MTVHQKIPYRSLAANCPFFPGKLRDRYASLRRKNRTSLVSRRSSPQLHEKAFFLMCVSLSTQTKSRQGLGKRPGCVVSWEGHLILGQTEARRAGRQKLFLLSGHCPSPYLSVWISHGPHLLEDLNPPMES